MFAIRKRDIVIVNDGLRMEEFRLDSRKHCETLIMKISKMAFEIVVINPNRYVNCETLSIENNQ